MLTPRLTLALRLSSLLLVILGSALRVSAQNAQLAGPPGTVPPPVTTLTGDPGDPGDPGNPPGSPGGPGGPADGPAPTATPAPAAAPEPKDMKDVKDMKSSITYQQSPNNYFEIFVSGEGTYGDIGRSNDAGHYDFTRAQGNLGFAYHFAHDWTVGTILSYAHTDAGFGNINASSTVDSYLPSLFAAYQHGGWWAYLSTTDGYDTFTEDRGTATGTAHGASNGFQYGGKLDGGYLFHCHNWSYGPLLDFHGYQVTSSGFREDGAGLNDLHFNRTDTDSVQSQIGGLVRYETEIGGMELEPYFSASWQREYEDTSTAFSGSTSTGAAFSGRSVDLDRNAALIDLGARLKVSSSVGVFLGWEGVVAGNYLTNTAEGGVNIWF